VRLVVLICVAMLAALVLVLAGLAEVAVYARFRGPDKADAALVLGAAVYGDSASPVFRERIRHAVSLYQAGHVRTLVMTGGLGAGDRLTEGDVAARWAREKGVPASAILVESRSRNTRENVEYSVPLLRAGKLDRVLIVSDPLHMRRAIAIATDFGLDAHPSPTPTTRYTGWGAWAAFLLSETYHLNRCRVMRRC
jgi:uncharacterized SAM-binding protein YcdF (DUF218 family)